MSPDRQMLRHMAAMILAIIAYVAPSAVQAHAGHAHHGHHMAAALPKAVVPVVATTPVPTRTDARAEAPAWFKNVLPTVEAARIESTEEGCCRPGCKTHCCGTMACCTIGVPAGPLGLSVDLFGAVTLVPADVAGRSGVGPEALPEPPRILA